MESFSLNDSYDSCGFAQFLCCNFFRVVCMFGQPIKYSEDLNTTCMCMQHIVSRYQ